MTLMSIFYVQFVLQFFQEPGSYVMIVDAVLPLFTWMQVVFWWYASAFDSILDNEVVFGSNELGRGTEQDMRAAELRQQEREEAEAELVGSMQGESWWMLRFQCSVEEATFQWLVGEEVFVEEDGAQRKAIVQEVFWTETNNCEVVVLTELWALV